MPGFCRPSYTYDIWYICHYCHPTLPIGDQIVQYFHTQAPNMVDIITTTSLLQCSVPYRYSAHTRMGCPICIWPAHTGMGQNSCFAHMRMRAHMRIGMLDHTSIATAMT